MDAGEDHDGATQSGIEHLQAAAREVLQATRSFLDAAEELIDDPGAVRDLIGAVSSVAQAAAHRLRSEDVADDGHHHDAERVQRIKVS